MNTTFYFILFDLIIWFLKYCCTFHWVNTNFVTHTFSKRYFNIKKKYLDFYLFTTSLTHPKLSSNMVEPTLPLTYYACLSTSSQFWDCLLKTWTEKSSFYIVLFRMYLILEGLDLLLSFSPLESRFSQHFEQDHEYLFFPLVQLLSLLSSVFFITLTPTWRLSLIFKISVSTKSMAWDIAGISKHWKLAVEGSPLNNRN